MKTYKYETHLHTSQASACASASGDDYIEKYIQAGYAGIIVTDHFFQGNTCVPNHESNWGQPIILEELWLTICRQK